MTHTFLLSCFNSLRCCYCHHMPPPDCRTFFISSCLGLSPRIILEYMLRSFCNKRNLSYPSQNVDSEVVLGRGASGLQVFVQPPRSILKSFPTIPIKTHNISTIPFLAFPDSISGKGQLKNLRYLRVDKLETPDLANLRISPN